MNARSLGAVVGLVLVAGATGFLPAGQQSARASFPGENGLIAFMRYLPAPENQCDIFTVDSVSLETVNLTNSPGCQMAPAWSPDGRRIAYTGTGGLTIANADGSDPRPVGGGVSALDPAWSPDGCAIAFESNADGGSLSILDLTTGSVRKVAHASGYALDGGPSWSPDGMRLAFVNSAHLWLVNPDGTQLTQLTTTPGTTPQWSPDGTRIAFSSFSDLGRNNIAIATIGGETTILTNNVDYSDEAPTWSPDGERIAYVRASVDAPFGTPLFAMDPDGTDVEPLMQEGESGLSPDWQPVGGAASSCLVVSSSAPSELPATGGDPGGRPIMTSMPFAAFILVSVLSLSAAAVMRRRSP